MVNGIFLFLSDIKKRAVFTALHLALQLRAETLYIHDIYRISFNVNRIRTAGGAIEMPPTLPRLKPIARRSTPPAAVRSRAGLFGMGAKPRLLCTLTPVRLMRFPCYPCAPPLAVGTFGKLSPRRARLCVLARLDGRAFRFIVPRRLRAWARSWDTIWITQAYPVILFQMVKMS